MQAGLLNRQVVFYKPITTTNEFGEVIAQQYVYDFQTRARVVNDSGNKGISNNEIVYSYFKTFMVRSYLKVKEAHQIEYQGKRYRILSLEEDNKSNSININAELING